MAQNWNTNYGPPQGPPPQQQQQYYPGPSQPYAPSAPQGPAYNTGGYEPKRTDNGERFVAKKGLNDPIILVLFLAQVSLSWKLDAKTFREREADRRRTQFLGWLRWDGSSLVRWVYLGMS